MRSQAYILLQAFAAAALSAQPVAIRLDSARSKIEFTLGDVLHTVHGTFKLRSGQIEIDPQSRALGGQVVVDATSGESGSGARDSRMEKAILEADRYPEIIFTPVSGEGDFSSASASVTVKGWLAIHGQRHQMSIPMQVKMSDGEALATGKFVVPYVAWGMKNPSTFLLRVSEQVEIAVSAAGSVALRPNIESHPK